MISDFHKLSPRELEIVDLISQGLENKEIAHKLFTQPNTISVQISSIKKKLGLKGGRAIVAVEALKWQIAKEGIVGIVREWLDAQEAQVESNV